MSDKPRSLPLHIALWVVQGLLALAFGMAGTMKGLQAPHDLVVAGVGWADSVPYLMLRFIALSEFLGAIGLILPSALRVLPKLTPLAALGLATIMALALPFHAMRGELMAALPVNLVLGGLAAFVAWGRAWPAPIPPRT